MFAFKVLLSSAVLALSVVASPVARAIQPISLAGGFPNIPGDNGSCQKVGSLCSAQIGDNYATLLADGQEFQISKECTLSALCYQMYYNGTVDTWINTFFGPFPAGTSPSKTAERFPQSLYNTLIAAGTTVATQQSFIDAYYSLLATVNGPYPDSSYVIAVWSRVAAWTGFCSTKDIPYTNLADWFQYSATSNYNPTCPN